MKLGRKGIKLRNRIILLAIVAIIIISIAFLTFPKLENEQLVYSEQTKSLIKNSEVLKENTEVKIYYVSETGVSTDGTDINNPMSLEEANKKTYYGNEKVLFKSGDTFYGTIRFNVKANDKEMFYIGAYGEGEKPIISGSYILSDSEVWKIEDGLYKLDLSNRDNFKGVKDTKLDRYNIGFIVNENENIYGNRKQKKELVINEYDYFCEGKFLYLKCSENPTKKLGEMRFVAKNDLVKLSSNTIIEGLNIQDTGAHGIVKKNNEIRNVYIKDCIIQNIGGSVQIENTFTRYGNGIEFWNQAQNTIVENNIIKNIYDAGYTIQGNTVTTGFYNNICRNNVFIKCTYTCEVFCHNMENELHGEIKKFNCYNNISINQGRGWGYEVRPDKNPSAEVVIWTISNPKGAEIQCNNNIYYNSRRLKYITKYTLDKNPDLQTIIASDGNRIYLNKDTFLFGNYKEKNILEKYKAEENSVFRTLSETEIQQIENVKILQSNNYEEIKSYYEKIESNFIYNDITNELILGYDLLKSENNIELIENDIINLKSIIENINIDNIDEIDLVELLKKHYELGDKLIEKYKIGKTNYNEIELISILKSLSEISENYAKLLNLENQNIIIDKQQTTDLIQDVNQIIDLNKDLNMSYSKELLDLGKAINDKEHNYLVEDMTAKQLVNWSKEFANIYIDKYIEDNPVTVNYSQTNLTNQDVIVTLATDASVEVTNNEGKRDYTYTQNGKFTFNYKIKGREFTIDTNVDYIDKEAPIIQGIEQGKVYADIAQPKIIEEHLKEVILLSDGQVVEGYQANSEIKGEGIYQLTAIDEAGNQTSVRFQIIENKEDGYKFEEDKIKNIDNNTLKKDFEEKLGIKEKYEIYRNEEIVKEEEKIAIGDVLKTEGGNEYILIVAGDINKDGDVGIHDIVLMRVYLLKRNNLDDIQKEAADANVDGKEINIKDLVRIRIMALTK